MFVCLRVDGKIINDRATKGVQVTSGVFFGV